MNKNGKIIDNKVIGGIEWLKTVYPDGTESRGATSNPVGGCLHGCRWEMPDGTIADCYAKNVAEGVAAAAYPHGFETHYWRPAELEKWRRVQQPMRIFWDSMSDLFGHWVPDEQVQAVLDAAGAAHWHTFLSLTKNAPRLLQFDLPANVWPGVSSPPDFMWGRRLSRETQARMLRKMLAVLSRIEGRITWASFEPLSWDVSPIVAEYPGVLRWAVIGAASNGKTKFQPESVHVQSLLDVLDNQDVPVFFKGNLRWSPRREEYPDT